MKLVFFGTPDFALPTLDRLVASSHQVVLVVSKADKAVGRQRELSSPPVAKAARRLGLPLLQPKKIKEESFHKVVSESDADVAVVVAYGKLIPASLLSAPPRGMVNLHPSLLPRHRGPSPIQWALVCGDRRTGVTTMLLDEGMDTGPILLQETVEIDEREDAEQLAERLAVIGAELVLRTLDELEAGRLQPQPQAADGANVTPMLRREFAKMDWSMPARYLVNRRRGFTPWPGLYTEFRGGRLKIFGLEEEQPPPAGDEEPGTVISASSEGIVVRCGRGSAARITEVQREGRRRMPVDAFQIGERVSRGERFG